MHARPAAGEVYRNRHRTPMTTQRRDNVQPWRTTAISGIGRVARALLPTHAPPAPHTVRRVLVIKPASLGDVLLAGPAISAVRRSFPHATLTLAVGQWSRPAATGLPDTDTILDLGTFGTPGRFGPRDLRNGVRLFRSGRYDLAIILDRSPLLALAARLASIPHRVGIDSDGRGAFHSVRVPWTYRRHEAELYLAVALAAGAPAENPYLAFRPTVAADAMADALWHRSLATDRPVVVIHPGGARNPGMSLDAKRWPADRFGAVATHLIEAGTQVVLVGHESDREATTAVRQHVRHDALTDLTGQADFATMAAFIGRADAFLGNDSVGLHLAVAMRTPAVAIYGPSDPRVYGPYAPPGSPLATRTRALVHPGACSQTRTFRPGPLVACPACRCIDLITVDAATAAIHQVVGRHRHTVPERIPAEPSSMVGGRAPKS